MPAIERVRKSRSERTKAGGLRLDVILSPAASAELLGLIEHWKSPTRKEAVENAIASVYRTIHPESDNGTQE